MTDRFALAFADCPSVDELRQLIGDAAHVLGFDFVALLHHAALTRPGPAFVRIDNYPPAWTDQLVAALRGSPDPIHAACERTGCGFRWQDAGRLVRLQPGQAGLFEAAREAGLGDGFSIPANLPGQPPASCSFAVRTGRDLPADRLLCAETIGAHALRAMHRLAQGVGDVVGKAGVFGSKIATGVVRGAVSSALSQGIGVVTGLQDKFSWAGVAAAGVGSGIAAGVGSIKGFEQLNRTGQRLASSMASSIAGAATRSIVDGSSFGDNLIAGLPDVLAQTIGGIIADGVAARGRAATMATSSAGANAPSGDALAAPGKTNATDDVQPGDIVVTASRQRDWTSAQWAAASAAQAARWAAEGDGDEAGSAPPVSLDRGSNPYPVAPEEMGGLTAWQLRAKKDAYLNEVAKSGETYTDNELNVKTFDDLIARVDVREAPATAQANAAANEIVYYGAVLPAQLAAEAVTGELLIGAAVKGYNFVRATRAARAAESAGPNLIPRLGPKGVDPLHHNANVLVRDAQGNVVAHQRFVSGNMTLEEQALGFPRNTLASHTEARAVRAMELQPGGRMTITGQSPPCPSCKGAMNRTATETGATIRYQWRQDGKTLVWIAKPKGQ